MSDCENCSNWIVRLQRESDCLEKAEARLKELEERLKADEAERKEYFVAGYAYGHDNMMTVDDAFTEWKKELAWEDKWKKKEAVE